MLFPDHIEEKLGFDKVRQLLRDACISVMGGEYVDRMRMVNDVQLLKKLLDQTFEFSKILSHDKPFPINNYVYARSFLTKGMIDGAFLTEEEFHLLRQMLRTVMEVSKYFKDRAHVYPELYKLCVDLKPDESLIFELDRKIDEKGMMKPSASKELQQIIQHIAEQEGLVRKRIQSIFKNVQENNWGPEGGMTIRDGRLVIALYAEHKRKIQGFIHDESATGQTIFIEPTEVFEANNYIRELYFDKSHEIRRILIELTTQFRPHFPMFELYCNRLGMYDFIRAKGLVANAIKATMPELSDKPELSWIDARHPLLYIHHKKQNKTVIPLTIKLNREDRIIVISGPNAGGKSVLLKTVGLLQMMLQYGMLIPVQADSKAGIFNHIFIDIGDEQSIDNDLSTYSSHLNNMKHFLKFANSKTLFLIDEFGTGTDPQFGGPMAEAILEQLNRKFSLGIVTTHYSNLKVFANQAHGIVNGSMMFDQAALQPLYQFDAGKPGSSYTFEIAHKIGLDKEVIEKAKSKAGTKQNNIDKLLIELEREKTYIKNLKDDTEKRTANARELEQKYILLNDELASAKGKIIREAKAEALRVIKDSNQLVEQTIREIKEVKAENVVTKEIRKKLDEKVEALTAEVLGGNAEKKGNKQKSIKAGDWVRIISSGAEAEVIQILKTKVEVMIGHIRTRADIGDVEQIDGKEKQLPKKRFSSSSSVDLNEKMIAFNAEINIIGKRGDEALPEVMRFIDEAIMLNFDRIRIVHGRGTGALKNMVRNELKKIPTVKHYGNEQEEFGGDAVTVVEFQ
jgi:DNA mismatch repair protein MutS2